MRIGELAKLSGLSPSRIRFYERAGLILTVNRKANGYRDYPPDAAWILEIINSAQRAGFSLEQIRHLLPVASGNWRHDDLLEALRRKITEIDNMQKRLKQNRAQLLTVIRSIENPSMDMNCSDRTKRVLDLLREDEVVPVKGKGRDHAAS